MKILIYNDWKTIVGGAERYIDNLIPHLTQKNQILFIAAEDVLPLTELTDAQRKISFWQKNKILIQFIKDQIEAFKPNVIHIHNMYFYTKSVLTAIKPYKPRTILTLHDLQYINMPKEKWWKYYMKHMKRNALNSVVQSFVAPSFIIYKIAQFQFSNHISYLPHFIDTQKWTFNNSLSNDKLKLLYVGNISQCKGVFFLLDVLKKLIADAHEVSLTFVGKGKHEQALQNEIQKQNLEDKAYITGYQTDKDIQQHFKNHFVLLFPSLCIESFGMVGLEAQASGLPVIVSNHGGIQEWASENETALMANPNDVQDWCSKINLLWTNKDLYQHIKYQAINQVKSKFKPDNHCETLHSIYSRLS